MSDQPEPIKEANFDGEARNILRHLKAKGLILIVLGSEKGYGISVQVEEESKAVLNAVPTILRRMASKMERDLVFSKAKQG